MAVRWVAAALPSIARLRIKRHNELGIPASTQSHHLERLRREDLVQVRRESSYLWYSANADSLRELLTFLYAKCCTRSKAVKPESIVQFCK